MADDIVVKDATGSSVTQDTKDIGGGVQRVRVEVASAPAGSQTDIGNSTTQTAITSDAVGTVLGFLRGLVKWAYERMPSSLGQKTKANSLSVTIASDDDARQLTAGSSSIGGVKDNGPFYPVIQETPATSADATAGLTITAAPASGKLTVVDDLLISVDTDMSVTIAEVSGATLSPPIFIKAKEPFTLKMRNCLRCVSVNKQVKITASVSGNIGALVSRHEE